MWLIHGCCDEWAPTEILSQSVTKESTIFGFTERLLQVLRMATQMMPSESLKAQRRFLRSQTRPAKGLAVVVLLFIVSWTPLYTFNTVMCFCRHCRYTQQLVKALIVLSHCNSAWNPAIYAWAMSDFRRALLHLRSGSRHNSLFASDYAPSNNVALQDKRNSMLSLNSVTVFKQTLHRAGTD